MIQKHKSIYGLVFAAFILIIVTFAGIFLANASGDSWDDYADTSWYDPIYTTFAIDTPAKLAGVAKLTNRGETADGSPIHGFSGKVLEIDRDLNVSAYSWIPIGTEANPFKGTLIAKGGAVFKLIGMKLGGNLAYAGFVGYMDGATVGGFEFTNSGSINIETVTQNVYVSNDVYVGAAVGKMVNNSTVFDIINNIDIEVSTTLQRAAVGGIVGAGEGTIANSVNHKSVTVAGLHIYVGGIAGYADNDGLKIKKAMNQGLIDARSNGSGDVYAGGITGYASGTIKMDEEDTPINNNATVKATNGQNSYAGGILGKAGGEVTFSNTTANTGAVNVESPQANSSYAGGLVGSIGANQSSPLFNMMFTNTMPVTNNGGTNTYTGGIAGFVDSAFQWGKSFTNSVDITATGKEHVYSGGLIGRVTGEVQFLGSANNTGTIRVSGGTHTNKPDDAYTGGLIGSAGNRVLLESTAINAYANSAEITVNGGTGLYTGGIVANRAYARASGAASNNVLSTGNISVTGQTMIYTGGFIGMVPSDGADKVISGATFAKDIKVTAAASGTANKINTGGIVGYYVNGSGSGNIANNTFQGKLAAAGGTDTYTGGIAGYMEGGTISNASIGNTASEFASITADGNIGGVAGYLRGSVTAPSVKYVTLTIKTVDGYAGGIAGKAQGMITGASIGAADFANSNSVRMEAAVVGAVNGKDKLTAGGIVGSNDNNLTITNSHVTKIGLITESGRSDYFLGAVAGSITADATIGGAGTPVEVHDVSIDLKAGNSYVGGAIGVNHSANIYLEAANIGINIPGASAHVGGIAGLNDADLSGNNHELAAQKITITAQGNTAHIGGLFGQNDGDVTNSQVETIKITAEGTANQIGGAVGRNTGSLIDSQVEAVEITANGAGAEVGGIVGHSEAADNSPVLVTIKNPSVLAGEAPLITAAGANAWIGGIVGFAETTEIVNPQIKQVIPDYAMLSVKAADVRAGGIAGQIVNGRIVGDASKTNMENLMISTSAAAENAYVGGIIGYNEKTRIDRIVANNVNLIINGEHTIGGGMAAYNLGTATAIITNNFVADLNIKVNAAAASSTIGGFVGVNDQRSGDPSPDPTIAVSTIQNSRIVGNIQVTAPSSLTGGMVGENRSLIANNSITDKIPVASKGNTSTLGGLVGLNTATGTLYYTYSNANLTVEGEGSLAGGLVGINEGQVISSYIDIDVTGNAYGTEGNAVFLGGLVGRNSGTIEKSHTASKITANGSYTNVGGLVGDHSAGTITNSYAAKEVAAHNNLSYAGGFIGRITNGLVSTSYSAGQVTGTNGAYAGGFIGRYDNASKDLLYKTYYVKDEDRQINKDLPDFAEGNHRWLNVHVRLSTILAATLADRETFPGLSGWDFSGAWKYGSLNADYKYPEINRSANTGGDGGSGNDVNANINWYTRDKDAIFFEIRTEAELAGLAGIVNGTVTGVSKFAFTGRTIQVVNPIHIQSKQWVPIGYNEDHAFQGTFEGNQHLIDGLSLATNDDYAGLFGVIGQQGKIANVKMEPLTIVGKRFTGVLAGFNQGGISHIEIKLLDGVNVSGGTVGGIVGKNIGAIQALSMTLDGGSSIKTNGNDAIAGGVIGENTVAITNSIGIKATGGSVGGSIAHATVGGIIGKQTGDVKSLNLTVAYHILTTGANNIIGGLIGHYVSGKAEEITLTFAGGTLKALGAASTLGGVIGQSDAGNTINKMTVTAAQEGQHLIGYGHVGGIIGVKSGKGNETFDIENVKTEKVVISALEENTHVIMGGIAGKLTDTALSNATFDGTIKAVGDRFTVGGIVGYSDDSILYKLDVMPDITSTARSGESVVGGIAGILTSSDIHRGFDLGKRIPFYRGIYEATVHTKTIKVNGMDNAVDLYAGGITGKNIAASIYDAKASSDMIVNGGKVAAVGGIAGFSDGIIVSSSAQNNIHADSSSIYHVGGVVGRAAGGEIHYTNMTSPAGEKITIGSAVTKPGVIPATHAGGFVGMADQIKITHSSADIRIEIVCTNQDNTIYAGGFAGLLGDSDTVGGLIQQAYAKGEVEIQGKTGAYAGGFVGSLDHYTITDAYATGNIANTGFDTRSGGFAAAVERKGSIKNAYAVQGKMVTTGINHATRAYAGGFAGYNDGALEGVYAYVPNNSMNAAGANVYQGALIGYQFRDGKVSHSAYRGSLNPIAYNMGSSVDVTQADVMDSFAFGEWNFKPDTAFLMDPSSAEIVVYNALQLAGVVLLYNDTGLAYYQLFNRTATEKPSINKIVLGADIDLNGHVWIPFARFTGEFDGKGKTITGFKRETNGVGSYGFISENYGKITNVSFDDVNLRVGANTGIVAGMNQAGAIISDIVIRGMVKGTDYTGGAAGKNAGGISNIVIQSLTIEGSDYVGGVVGENTGTISQVELQAVTLKGGNYVGGAAGENKGTLTNSIIQTLTVTGGNYIGGVAGENKGALTNSDIQTLTVTGSDYVGGVVGRSKGTLSNINIQTLIMKGSDYAGGAAGKNESTISTVAIAALTLEGAHYVGGLTGLNSGTLEGSDIKGSITATGNLVGGAAGANEGQINKTYSRGSIVISNPDQTVAAGGLVGENKAAGAISHSFSFTTIDVTANQVMVGGIAGVSYGDIRNSYNSGQVKAEGTAKSWAGGIVGHAVGGTVSNSLNYGEVVAGSGGEIQRKQSYFGGIAGQKEAAAAISHTAFNRQMLKTNTAYYDVSGNRVTGVEATAAGMLARELTLGVLPVHFDPTIWQAVQGFYPQLAVFDGTSAAKLSTTAVIMSDNDLVNQIAADFELTKDGQVAWTVNPVQVVISDASGRLKGSLLTTGSTTLTAKVNDESRSININVPALKYHEVAAPPKVISGEVKFYDKVSVVLAADERDGKVYYTLDGSLPGLGGSSRLYSEPILLTQTTTIRAITIVDEKENSEVLSGVWTKLAPPSIGGGYSGAFIPVTPKPAIGANLGKDAVQVDGKTPIAVAKNSKLTLTAPKGQIIYYTIDGSTPTKNSPQYKGELLITGNMTIKAITDQDERVVTISYQVENAKYEMKSNADQIKYISGYEDGLFKPDAAITRYELIEVLAPLLDMEEVSVGSLLTDVRADKAELVAFFGAAGIVEGYPNGTFGGERGMTRAEFVVMMARVLKLDITQQGKTVLSDLKDHWSEKYVNAFTAAGYVNGFPDSTFKPDNLISRAEAIVVINRIIGTKKQYLPTKYSDLTPAHWAYEDIMPVVK